MNVKIGALTYRIELTTNSLNARSLYGEWDGHNQVIKIHAETSSERQKEVLLHECVHAIVSAYAMRATEADVTRLGHGLAAMFRDNPDLLEWLK